MGKDLMSPAFLYTAPFCIALLCGAVYADKWSLELHFNTFVTILCGAFLFVLICTIVHFSYGKWLLKTSKKKDNRCTAINVESWKIVLTIIVQVDDVGNIKFVPDRAHSRVAKAPQCFVLSDILYAHEKALSEGINTFIDCCTMMQHYGYALHMTDGPYENIKITTPDDFYMMRAILQAKEDAQIYGID